MLKKDGKVFGKLTELPNVLVVNTWRTVIIGRILKNVRYNFRLRLNPIWKLKLKLKLEFKESGAVFFFSIEFQVILKISRDATLWNFGHNDRLKYIASYQF